MSYARMDDNNSESYEYQTQWSLRGGNVYPANPRWTRGAWEGVTLAPPVQPHTIEFEADLDQMEEMEIVRTTLQVRYMKFGKEVETNIPISGAKGEPLTEKMIFIDRETQGYAYRLIFNHKTEGKLALDWTSKINDDYVYAVIPDELQDKGSKIFNRAIEAAKTIIRPEKDGTVKPEAKVLDAFQDIFGIIRN